MIKHAIPTMSDVAKRCGVTASTVSRVLSGTKFVTPETRAVVLRSMQELNFHRDSHARRLARGRSDFLGLIISNIENPFYPGLIKAFETAALERGFEVLLCTTNYDPLRTEQAFRRMIENKCPGVAVMTSRVDSKMAQWLGERGIESVFLDSDGVGPLKSNIRIDYAKGASEAIRHLHTLGHRRFALIAGPQDRASHAALRHAVEAALRGFGLKLQLVAGQNDEESGAEAVRWLLTSAARPTAILCSNDMTALGAIRALRLCSLRVPEQISVVGADDIPFAALAHPPLSTIRIPRERLGALASEILQTKISTRAKRGKEFVLAAELVIRESTGPAPVPR